MGVFRFRRFDVVNEKSAMKVNTDGVLLGTLMTLDPDSSSLLDVGTGTGTVALIAAQRLDSMTPESRRVAGRRIFAVEPDADSADEASLNFLNSPWPGLFSVSPTRLQEYCPETAFDHIFSNPPYFEDSLKSAEFRRMAARHSVTLSYRDIIDFAVTNLSEGGTLSLILPSAAENPLERYGAMNGLYMFRIVRVRTSEGKAPSRIVAEFSRNLVRIPSEETLVMRNSGDFSEEYVELTRDFYLWQGR